jgi:hypothetical protein
MLADLYVKSWSVLRTVNTAYPPLFRLFGLLAVNFARAHLWILLTVSEKHSIFGCKRQKTLPGVGQGCTRFSPASTAETRCWLAKASSPDTIGWRRL